MTRPLRILIVEDIEDDALLLVRKLERAGYQVTYLRIETALALEDALTEGTWDMVISDFSVPGFGGMAALEICRRSGGDIPFLMVSGTIGEDIAVEAMRAGANDYVMKGNLARLAPAVERELKDAEIRAEQKRAERALAKSEDKYRILYDDNPSMYFTLDVDGAVLSVNRFGASQLGYSTEELVGRPVYKVFLTEDHETVAKQIARCLKRPSEVFHWEIRKIRKDRSVLWVKEAGRAIAGTTGSPVILVVCEDITERKRAEGALRASEERYRRITETVTDYVYTVRVEDDRAVETIHGPGCVAVTGYEPEQFTRYPQLWLEMVKEEDRSLVLDQAQRILRGLAPPAIEHRIIRKDGQERWVRNTPSLLRDENGRLLSYDGLIQDVTERRHLQDQLLQSQKMEAIGRLAGGVAHDFNNLLTVILGYAELMIQDLKVGDPLRGHAEQIVGATEKASALTRQLLAFSRKQVLEPKVFELNSLIEDNSKMLKRIIGEDIELSTCLAPGKVLIKADPAQIEQILLNLVVNARDAMPQGGRVMIETSLVPLGEDCVLSHPSVPPGAYATLIVSDNGCGMDDETKSHVFEPFFTTKAGGTGLGLATVYGVVEQSGGHIVIDSEPGKGTAMRIYFPVAEKTDLIGFPRETGIPRLRGTETVLVVEDDAMVRGLTCLTLRRHGYQVVEVADGNEALRFCERFEGPIHLLLTDLVMPGLNGRQLALEAARFRPGIKVLFMSGHAGEGTFEHGLVLTGSGFIQKPFTPDALARRMRDLLEPFSKPVEKT